MIRFRVPRWLLAVLWVVFAVPALVAVDGARAAWLFLDGNDERPSHWEWVSVVLVVFVAAGTLGHAQRWW